MFIHTFQGFTGKPISNREPELFFLSAIRIGLTDHASCTKFIGKAGSRSIAVDCSKSGERKVVDAF
jgi:hypothetical protein